RVGHRNAVTECRAIQRNIGPDSGGGLLLSQIVIEGLASTRSFADDLLVNQQRRSGIAQDASIALALSRYAHSLGIIHTDMPRGLGGFATTGDGIVIGARAGAGVWTINQRECSNRKRTNIRWRDKAAGKTGQVSNRHVLQRILTNIGHTYSDSVGLTELLN